MAKLEVKFRHPVPLEQPLTLVGEMIRLRSRTLEGWGDLSGGWHRRCRSRRRLYPLAQGRDSTGGERAGFPEGRAGLRRSKRLYPATSKADSFGPLWYNKTWGECFLQCGANNELSTKASTSVRVNRGARAVFFLSPPLLGDPSLSPS